MALLKKATNCTNDTKFTLEKICVIGEICGFFRGLTD